MSYLRIFLFASLIIGAKAQGFDLADALDDDVPTKPPRKPDQPKKPSGGDLDLFDALRPDPKDPAPPPKKPPAGGDGFDLSDALNPDPVAPKNPSRPVNPPRNDGKGGGSFGDSDLHDLLGGDSEYKPDPGKGGGGGGGGAHDPYDYDGGRGYDDGQKANGSSKLTGILSAVGVAVVGVIASYFGYKKRQSCLGAQGGYGNQRGGGRYNDGYRGRYGPAGNRGGAGGAGGAGGGAAGIISNILRMV